MNSKISEKDKKDWEHFLQNKEKLPVKDKVVNLKNKILIKSLDLHGYSLDEANKQVDNFIRKNFADGASKLIIVTGKGLHSQNEKNPYISKNLSILKHSVPEFIQNNKYLMKMITKITEAEIKDGGSGAIYIYLKKNT